MSEKKPKSDHFVVLKLFRLLLKAVGVVVLFAGSDTNGSFHCFLYYHEYTITAGGSWAQALHTHLTSQAGFIGRIKLLARTWVGFRAENRISYPESCALALAKIFLPLNKTGVFLHPSGIFGRKASAVWQKSDRQGVTRNTNTSAAPVLLALLSCFHGLWLVQTCVCGTHVPDWALPAFPTLSFSFYLPTISKQPQPAQHCHWLCFFLHSCSCWFLAVTHRGWSVHPSLPAIPGTFQ